MATLTRSFLLAVCLALLLPGRAVADPPLGKWVTLGGSLRVTFYGPRYTGGEVTASGIRYAPDADIVALGPDLLTVVRAHYAAEAEACGAPMVWYWLPGPRLRYQGIAGGFPRHPCFDPMGFHCKPDWWGYFVRICDPATGHCETLRLADTGSDGLEVDLPDRTWLRFGYPSSRGVFTGTLEVLSSEF